MGVPPRSLAGSTKIPVPPFRTPPALPTPPPGADGNPGLGIAFMLISTLIFAGLWCLIKALTGRYSVHEITFFRNFFALIPAVAMVVRTGRWETLKVKRISGHIWRTLIGLGSMELGFLSYHLMPLADAVSVSFVSPLLVTALSVPLLKEKVGVFRWSAVLVGFCGVVVIVDPGSGFLNSGALVALGGAFCSALAIVTIRQISRVDNPIAIVFYFTLFSTVLTALPLPFVWMAPRDLLDWAMMLAMGLLGGVGQYFWTRAFGLAPAVVVSPFNYVSLLWATLAGWAFWGDLPGTNVYAGAAVVIASGLFILYRETRKGIR